MTDTAVLAEVPDDAESLQAQAAVLRNILLHGGTLGAAGVLMLDDPAPLLHSAECCIAIQQMEGAAEALRMAIGLIDQEPQHEALRPRAQALLAPLAAAGH